MRPDSDVIVAAGQLLFAASPEELAEIAECALAAGDRIELIRARDEGGWRLLTEREFKRFLRSLPPLPY
jgi:hypothetical protein